MFHDIEVLLEDTQHVPYLQEAVFGSLARSAATQVASQRLWEYEVDLQRERLSDEALQRLRQRENDACEYLAWTLCQCPESILPVPEEVVDWLISQRFTSEGAQALLEERTRLLKAQLGEALDDEVLDAQVAAIRQERYQRVLAIRDQVVSYLRQLLSRRGDESYVPDEKRQLGIVEAVLRKLEARKGKSLDKVVAGNYVAESIADIALIEPLTRRAVALARRLSREQEASVEPIADVIH